MNSAVDVLHRHGFTGVRAVIDAPRGPKQRLTVNALDCKRGMAKSPDGCPAAVAGQRRGRKLIVFLTRTYEVLGPVARRWVNSPKLQAAIIVEDKTKAFPPGSDYFLMPPDRWKRSGSYRGHKSRGTGSKQRQLKPSKRHDLSVRRWA